jgi:hypothetical protein
MKSLLLIPLLMLAGCASRSQKRTASIQAALPSRAVNATELRTGEQLREYRFGRYVDPGDSRVMHEGHPIYRVEASAGWNLRPSGERPLPKRALNLAPSTSENDAVVAEVNKQRAATRAFTEQTTTLNQRLGELATAAAQTQDVAKQNLALRRDVAALRERLDSIDTRLRERPRSPADQPPPRTEDKW